MAEYGEWTRKGATLSDVTARKEYGVNSDFIIRGINAGTLEYREGAIHGNPYIPVSKPTGSRSSLTASATTTCAGGKRRRSCGKSSRKSISCANGSMSLRHEERRSKGRH